MTVDILRTWLFAGWDASMLPGGAMVGIGGVQINGSLTFSQRGRHAESILQER